ncbi:MAG TPA: glycine dehydrogenase, partial [Tahibacter sp.]|nr:glycine dehydrogenase [Tahibacter sp.]
AAASMDATRRLRDALCAIDGVEPLFARPFFHEVALRLPKSASEIVETLAHENIVAGFALGEEYPEFGDALLVCATETKTQADLDRFAAALAAALR